MSGSGADDDTVRMRIGPAPLGNAVLVRVLTTLAARADLPVDRVPDVAESLATLARLPDARDAAGHLDVVASLGPRTLCVAIHGLDDLAARRIAAADGRSLPRGSAFAPTPEGPGSAELRIQW